MNSTVVLRNAHGVEAHIALLGAVLQSFFVPDSMGVRQDVVMTYDQPWGDMPAAYDDVALPGAVIGRVAGPIRNASFSIDGEEFLLEANAGQHSMNGGLFGFDRRIWTLLSGPTAAKQQAVLSYISPDGEEGFPGVVNATVMYVLDENDRLTVKLEADTDYPTPVSLAHNAYWNLGGHKNDSVLDYSLFVNGDYYLEMDPEGLPTGKLLGVGGTPADFTGERPMADGVATQCDALDTTYVVFGYDGAGAPADSSTYYDDSELQIAARVTDPKSGRVLWVYTDAPAVRVTTSTLTDIDISPGIKCDRSGDHEGVAVVAQHFLDALHHSSFPSIVLQPGDTFSLTVAYEFHTVAELDVTGAGVGPR